ncbi:triose-phosphate isomerase family protein [Microbacterium atlanticum]|uniref:triose-phosphate isomerase family protein n=1 Tax=Microbacterium atlanticum TaxID=2782168 RepID=UPI00188776D9|nr:triose-phosphate isomerase family protein [Microbacterium atlanticum]
MLIGASHKMYLSHAQTVRWMRDVADIVGGQRTPGVMTFAIPQFPSIPACVEIGAPAGVAVGAQDLSTDDVGALTGEVSGGVLAELGCRYVEVGHAERRRIFGETDEVVAAKVHAALRNGLIPILCVGEERRGDAAAAVDHCLGQIAAGLAAARAAGTGGEIVVAYEPVWAIGAAEPADAEHIRAVCGALRDASSAGGGAPVIYGGSAGPGLLTQIAGAVDGLFLGRFAHDPAAFRAILDEATAVAA